MFIRVITFLGFEEGQTARMILPEKNK